MNAWDNPTWVYGMILLGIASIPFHYIALRELIQKSRNKPEGVSWFGGLKYP
jgi:hypothetical protein